MTFDTVLQLDYLGAKYLSTLLQNPILEQFFIFVTALGNKGVFWILLACILLAFPQTRPLGVGVVAALLIGFVGGELVLKNLVQRPRPFVQYNHPLLIPPPSGYSFPSGHTLSSFAAATCIFIYNKKVGVPLLLLAALIGLSRLVLFVHYPTDVLGGAVLGVLSGFGGFLISLKFPPPKAKTTPLQ